MAYLGYKNIAFRKYKEEQEKIRMWKKAEAKKRKDLRIWIRANESKKKKLKDWSSLAVVSIVHLALVVLLIVFYGLFASALVADEKGSKVGVGGFVMAVSYTDSYDDLVYVSNFVNCDHAMKYYNDNCTDAKIMMCQQEAYLYMPIGHNSDSSFDFEPTDKQSCGFVGVQKPTFIEE